jgi:transposase-like protein
LSIANPGAHRNMNKEKTTWKTISEHLGVTQSTLSKWRKKFDDCPAEPNPEEWDKWILEHASKQEQGSGRLKVDGREYTADDIHDLKAKLIAAQERRENAMAQIRELELQQKKNNLVPESQATEAVIKLLTPLRRLLDALPRQVAAQANPGNPSIAEMAIRNGLDDRIFAEIQKILRSKQIN